MGKPFFDFDMNSLFLIYAIHRTNLLLLVKIQRINMSFLYGFQLTQLVKSLIDKKEICGLITTYTKNQLISWFDDKEQSSGTNIIS